MAKSESTGVCVHTLGHVVLRERENMELGREVRDELEGLLEGKEQDQNVFV